MRDERNKWKMCVSVVILFITVQSVCAYNQQEAFGAHKQALSLSLLNTHTHTHKLEGLPKETFENTLWQAKEIHSHL